ncbi:hypothetical protein ACM66B_001683 [Microbotryomycetes sp. NB124-2]
MPFSLDNPEILLQTKPRKRRQTKAPWVAPEAQKDDTVEAGGQEEEQSMATDLMDIDTTQGSVLSLRPVQAPVDDTIVDDEEMLLASSDETMDGDPVLTAVAIDDQAPAAPPNTVLASPEPDPVPLLATVDTGTELVPVESLSHSPTASIDSTFRSDATVSENVTPPAVTLSLDDPALQVKTDVDDEPWASPDYFTIQPLPVVPDVPLGLESVAESLVVDARADQAKSPGTPFWYSAPRVSTPMDLATGSDWWRAAA